MSPSEARRRPHRGPRDADAAARTPATDDGVRAAVRKAQQGLHPLRKAWHALPGFLIHGIYRYGRGLDHIGGTILLGYFTAVLVGVDVLRLHWAPANGLYLSLVAPLLRVHEIDGVSGTTWYMVGCNLAILLLPKAVALLAILFLALGDPAAATLGRLFGHHSVRFPNGKSLVGTLACAAVCALLVLVFFALNGTGMDAPTLALVCAVAAIAAAVGEYLEIVDDNVTLPLVSGLGLWAAAAWFGWDELLDDARWVVPL